ncbi:transcriptional repressor AgaR [Psychrobium sp. 1_MG-2023]|uniref:transcriptional repressor AgaR n=1 Tax=Psychrobium sp. 1_MG-2023 TaxID=3062624 RepID=UPI0027368D48|nr:transcriptional repressor AgaR [Psychrobium sp. 1_MG-2023]MDP2560757.1 transcriptional repressor AgaR [Psychrobium sp. 1_MG-2023]
MNTIERRQHIVKSVARSGKVAVSDLVTEYNVSAVTIRSDLNFLHQRGLLIRTRGGAIACNRISPELSIDDKYNEHAEIKKKIALAASQLIEEDDAIILDSGTTTAELALCLGEFKNLVVMTNGLNVAQNLTKSLGVQVLMTGGTLRKKSLSFYGSQAEESLSRYHFNKVILGVDGIDLDVGITTHFEAECVLNRKMCSAAREVIVVTDSSKFNAVGVHKILDLQDVSTLVTDDGIPDDIVQTLLSYGIRIIIAE